MATAATLGASVSTSAFKTYNRADYDRIKREGFTFVLPAETMSAIKTIEAYSPDARATQRNFRYRMGFVA
jgi:hypothetical protein